SCEPRSRVFVVQTADPLPGFEKRFLDRIFGQCLIAQDQTRRSEQLEAVAVHDLLEGVTVAFSPAGDDAHERWIHEHANGMTPRASWTGETPPPRVGEGIWGVGRTVIISSRIAAGRRGPAPRSRRAVRGSERRWGTLRVARAGPGRRSPPDRRLPAGLRRSRLRRSLTAPRSRQERPGRFAHRSRGESARCAR